MAIRASMAQLLDKLRLLVGDPVTATDAPLFSDAQLQDALDLVRQDVKYEVLKPRLTLAPTSFQYLDYYSIYDCWESDGALLGPDYSTLTPLSAEWMVGHWTFPAGGGGSGQFPPVFLAGKTYDLYRAAADLCEYRAVFTVGDFSFTADGATFHPEQASVGWQARADYYKRKCRPLNVRLTRRDGNADSDDRAWLGPVSSGVPFITGD